MSVEDVRSKVGQRKILWNLAELDYINPGSALALDIETYGDGKRPGDTFKAECHGIAGVSFCGASGDAYYVPMTYKKSPGAGDSFSFCRSFSRKLEEWGVKAVATHYGKFDYGFLWSHGLILPKDCFKLDTWILHNLNSVIGDFKSNKLKDIMRDEFGINTSTEEEKDNTMKALNTEDYGELSPEVLAPYACDDVRYAYLLSAKLFKDIAAHRGTHDRYMKAWWNLIYAEDAGISLAPSFESRLAHLKKAEQSWLQAAAEFLISTKMDVKDDSQVLSFLSSKGLHPPRWKNDEGFRFDREAALISAQNDEFTQKYLYYRLYRDAYAVLSDPVHIHHGRFFPSFLLSIYSRSGLPVCKAPDMEKLVFGSGFRSLFAPPRGKKFYHVRIRDLFSWFLTGGESFDGGFKFDTWLDNAAKEAGCTFAEAQVLLRKVIEGFGFKVLKDKLSQVIDRGRKRDEYGLYDSFVKAINKKGILRSFDGGSDFMDRRLKISDDKKFRKESIWLMSSYGHVVCEFMNILCDELKGSDLVFVHGPDFLFETDKEKDVLDAVVKNIKIKNKNLSLYTAISGTCWPEFDCRLLDLQEREVFSGVTYFPR